MLDHKTENESGLVRGEKHKKLNSHISFEKWNIQLRKRGDKWKRGLLTQGTNKTMAEYCIVYPGKGPIRLMKTAISYGIYIDFVLTNIFGSFV